LKFNRLLHIDLARMVYCIHVIWYENNLEKIYTHIGAEPRLVKDNAIIALRRPKPHEGFFGDYKVSYNPGMAPLGDEVYLLI